MLYSPFTLPCGAIIPNRLVKSAMSEYLSDSTGKPHKGFDTLYARWAQGGVGLNISGNVMIDSRSREEIRNTVIEDESSLEALTSWATAGQQNRCKLWMQLNHPGRQARSNASTRIVSASDIQIPFLQVVFKKPQPLTEAGIQEIIHRFGNTARIAKKAGFSGVQIHSAHGYLLSQFLSPITNQRTDKWGGSIANRARLLLAVLAEIRKQVGTSFPIGVKLNSADFQRGGFTEEDSLHVIDLLSEAGIDLIEVSGGTYESPAMIGNKVKESTRQREAYFAEFIIKARERTKCPLLLTGGFRTKAVMEQALKNNEVDFIGLARPFATIPDLPNQLKNGSLASLPSEQLTTGVSFLDGLAVLDVYWYADQMKRMAKGLSPDPRLNTMGTFLRNTSANLKSFLWRGSKT